MKLKPRLHYFALFLLLPQPAFACGLGLAELGLGALVAMLGIAFFVALPAVPVWGAKRLWEAISGSAPEAGVFSVSSAVMAVALAAYGVFVIPSFRDLFADFGANLPVQTSFVLEQNYLLLAPGILLALLVYLYKGKPRSERLHAGFLMGESALLCLTLWALYSPIFKMC